MTDPVKLYLGDCLEVMKQIEPNSIDMILCDLPYGTTSCKWDTVIPFEELWGLYNQIIKPNGAIVLTASQPFTTSLISSNIKMFRYCWYWSKNKVTGFANSKKQPLRCVEDVVVFYSQVPTYNPQGLIKVDLRHKNGASVGGESLRSNIDDTKGKGRLRTAGAEYIQEFTNYPRQILNINCELKTVHPTQKPVALMEYLIRTYTNEGQTVLDNCMGSGSTGVACVNANRKFVGIEKESSYFDIAQKRISDAQSNRNCQLGLL